MKILRLLTTGIVFVLAIKASNSIFRDQNLKL